MKDRVDIEKLDKDLYDMNATIEYRAQVVINTLREKAAQTQMPILNYLNEIDYAKCFVGKGFAVGDQKVCTKSILKFKY